MRQRVFKAIDLFCGAGGLSLGLSNAGFKVIAGIEINPTAAETYRVNHPKSIVYEQDIRDISVENLLRKHKLKPGDLDLLAGCPPCQGFSTQGTRNRAAVKDDDRNNLIFEFLRVVALALPKTIMLENVPALARDWRIEKLKKELDALGYIIDDEFIQIKDAADYGVPQRRKRLLIKASRYGSIPSPKKVQDKVTVRAAIAHLLPAGESGDLLHDLGESRSKKVQEIISLVPKDGGSRHEIPRRYWLECHKRQEGSYRDVYGRMRWDDVAPTMTGGCHNPSKGRFIHPVEDRAITLREAALLQSFPSTYQFLLNKGKDHVALMIGNALPPEFIRRHAQEYLQHLKEISNDAGT
ncbi:DNA cytosine methyltransferase [Hydrogenophaga sp. BPS33]|uniref:DNA cytosine methyltransferase n=1 Tax=Hydrogenophaga sp. BPS33 TaxID=2651974 RepID=UPI00131FB9E4|nr:DNA cytosine methyltransferase [Hydrogenophaga sp. BPS33]QHE85071.1 DNA cytosine methyltransferase [Hydrogenophaga sp. BPS33]